MKKRCSEEQIIGSLREADAGLPVKELCRSTASVHGSVGCAAAEGAGDR